MESRRRDRSHLRPLARRGRAVGNKCGGLIRRANSRRGGRPGGGGTSLPGRRGVDRRPRPRGLQPRPPSSFSGPDRGNPSLYSEAAKHYYWVLNDAACPPERARRAWFNRGTSLLRQPGATMAVYRSAIACLERCLDSKVADAPLRWRAYNLKLAKLLWNEARKKDNEKTAPTAISRRRIPAANSNRKVQGFDNQPGNPEMGEGNTGAERRRSFRCRPRSRA